MLHYVYILKCSDDSYYVGMTMNLERRVSEHQGGYLKGSYTSTRLPVVLMWTCEFPTRVEAVQFERQVKGWKRVRKEALIRGELSETHAIVKRERKTREAVMKKAQTSN